MTSPFPAAGSKREREFAYASVRNAVFDSVRRLLERRRIKDGLTRAEVARRLDRDPAWVSRTLSGPGNWTLQTWSDFVFALDGYVQLDVPPREEVPRGNYDIYADPYEVASDAPLQHASSAGDSNSAMLTQTYPFAKATTNSGPRLEFIR